MEDKLTSRDMNEEMDDRGEKKPQTTTASQSPVTLNFIRDQTGMFTKKREEGFLGEFNFCAIF